MIGSRIGPFEITAKLGEGGMGEVWRATDSRLKREVAIKVLPAAFTADRERLARFEREAQVLAQLHHPHISSIFGLEESGGGRALVMELVDGPTLAERLEAGPLSVEESLSVARQIAEALEAAHEKGTIHRDLKPQNVKAPVDGTVKVLDFGLAKALDPTGAAATSAAQLAASPTLTAGATVHGMILGTAAYMSPEQARGLPVDKRADVWAFGVVLFEMLTGARLFGGDSVSETLAGVLKDEIDLGALPAATPPAIRRLLRRCLERNPRNRLHDIADARIVLDELREGRGIESVPPPPASRRSTVWLGAAGILLLGMLVGAAGVWRGMPFPATADRGGRDAGFHRFTRLTFQSGLESSPALSPDGEHVAFAAIDGGDRDIFLLRVGGERTINLTDDSPADDDHPAFSPDGRFLAFRSEREGGGLFVMGATGESVRRLTTFGENPSWSPDGREIVFATEGESNPHGRERTSELWVVAARGGEPRRIFAGDAVQPSWSPGGHRIAFWSVDQGIRDVWTVAADGSDPQRVTAVESVDWNPAWAGDGRHLYFASDRSGVMNPWRVAIDERTGLLRGEPQPITLPTGWSGQISLSADERRFLYRTSELTAQVRRLPFDAAAGRLTGAVERIFDTAIPAVGFDLAADGSIVFRTAAMQEDVYVMQADGSGLRRLTDDAAKDRNPLWSPDGSQVAFYSNRSGIYEVWTVDRDGSDLRQRTRTPGTTVESSTFYPVWSPDGGSMVVSSGDRVARFGLRQEPVETAQMEKLPIDDGDAAFVLPLSWSPDGSKIAGVRIGQNGQLLGGVVVYELSTQVTRWLAVPPPAPPSGHIYPRLAWLPDSRRGVVRWGSRLLLVDSATETIATLLDGLPPDGGIVCLGGDGRSLYMLDSRDEGDLWLASRDAAAEGPP